MVKDKEDRDEEENVEGEWAGPRMNQEIPDGAPAEAPESPAELPEELPGSQPRIPDEILAEWAGLSRSQLNRMFPDGESKEHLEVLLKIVRSSDSSYGKASELCGALDIELAETIVRLLGTRRG